VKRIMINLLFVMFMVFVSNPPAALSEDLLFHAGFEDSIDANFAGGSRAGRYMNVKEKPVFRPGKSDKGISVGRGQSAVIYQADGNIFSDEGSLTFWVKADEGKGWHNVRGSGGNYVFFRARAENKSDLLIYKYDHSATVWMFLRVYDDYGSVTTHNLVFPAFNEYEWNCIGMVWEKENGIEVYLNGVPVASNGDYQMPAELVEFSFGNPWAGAEDNRIQDELKIYSRAFNRFEMMDLYRTEAQIMHAQVIGVPPLSEPVTVDGVIDSDEWKNSVRFPLTYNASRGGPAHPLTWVNLGYDKEFLYFSLSTRIPDEALEDPERMLLRGALRSNETKHDTAVIFDDSYELRIAAFDPASDNTKDSVYRLVVNGINTHYDYELLPPKNHARLQWDPDWETASVLSSDRWQVEGKIPFSSFGNMPEAGDVWGISFFRIWWMLKEEINGLVPWGEIRSLGWRDAVDGMARMLFLTGNDPVLQIVSMDGLTVGEPDLKFTVRNQSAQSIDAQFNLCSANDEKLLEQRVALAGSEAQEISFSAPEFYNSAGAAELSVSVSAPDAASLFNMQFPVTREEGARITFKYYPSYEKIRIGANISSLGSAQNVSGVCALKKSTTEESVAQCEVIIKGSLAVAELDIHNVPAGLYTMELRLKNNESGQELTEERKFEKQPLPDWLGNTIGVTGVPVPWSPVELSENKIRIWGRDYVFGSLLPVAIDTQDTPLLTAPAYLTGVINKKSETLAAGENTVSSHTPEEICLAGSAAGNGWKFSSRSTVEFDGFCWTVLTLEAIEDIEVDQLSVTFPLAKEAMTLINPSDHSLITTGRLPQEGWKGAVRPLWLGDEDAGIHFIWEQADQWKGPVDEQIHVRCAGDNVTVQMNLIAERTVYKKGSIAEFPFGFQATPVKPIRKYRDWRIAADPATTAETNVTFVQMWTPNWSVSPDTGATAGATLYPMPKDNLAPLIRQLPDGRKLIQMPYNSLKNTWPKRPEFELFKDEWLLTWDKQINEVFEVACPAPSYRDYYMYTMNHLFEKTDVPGLYYDVSLPNHCANPMCKEHALDGLNFKATRALLRRVYSLAKSKDPDSIIVFHSSSWFHMPVLSFADMQIVGENFAALLDHKNNRGYEKTQLTLDAFRAAYRGDNLGHKTGFLPQFSRVGSIKWEEWNEIGSGHADYIIGMTLLHDALLWVAYFPKEFMAPLYDIFNQTGWGNDWEYIPYWTQQYTQTLPIDDTAVSFYKRPDGKQYMAVVFNATDQEQSLQLEIDLAAMGLSAANTSIQKMLPDHQEIPLKKSIQINMPQYSYQVYLLTDRIGE